MEDILTVAVVNFKSSYRDIDSNIRRMKGYAAAALRRGADIVLLPEVAQTGADFICDEDIPLEEKHAAGREPSEQCFNDMSKISKKYGGYIVYGAVETTDDDKFYNCAFVCGPEGKIGRYRKIHPFWNENAWFDKGTEPFMFNTPWGPVGVGICYDTYQFPELMRYYVDKGARLYLNPTALMEEVTFNGSHESFLSYYSTLDYGVLCNTIFIASSNLTGYDHGSYFGGGSIVIGPKITPFYETDIHTYGGSRDDAQEGISMATIDLSLAKRRLCMDNPFSGEPEYRPELYKTWN